MAATKSAPAKVQPSNPNSFLSKEQVAVIPLSSDLLTETGLVEDLPPGVVTVRTLRYWRGRRTGPPWSKIGRTVVYSRQKFQEWISRNEINIEPEPTKTRRRGADHGPSALTSRHGRRNAPEPSR
jgi:hypothetical protein